MTTFVCMCVKGQVYISAHGCGEQKQIDACCFSPSSSMLLHEKEFLPQPVSFLLCYDDWPGSSVEGRCPPIRILPVLTWVTDTCLYSRPLAGH